MGANGTELLVESPQQQEYPTSERSLTIVEAQQQPGLGIGFVLPPGAAAPNIVGGKATVGFHLCFLHLYSLLKLFWC